jgi:hypothetical protein
LSSNPMKDPAEARHSVTLLRVGSVDVTAILHYEIYRQGNDVVGADVVLDPASLRDVVVDWIGDVRILEQAEETTSTHFTGLVSRVALDDDELHLQLSSRSVAMQDAQLGGGGTLNITPVEVIVSLLRGGGLSADQMNIAGYAPGPEEAWEVAVPVDGLLLSAERRVGTVRLLPSSARPYLPVGLGPDGIRERFDGAATWAIAFVTRPTAYDADLSGCAEIDLALAWLVTRAHYSTALLPDGEIQRYQRDRGRALATRRDVVLAHGLQTHRYSLRAPGITSRPQLDLDTEPDLDLPQLPATLSLQEREAVEAWRRAIQEPNPLAQTSALWEAVEYLVTGRTAPETFTPTELDALRARACDGLDERQRERVLALLDQLNSAPLLARLRSAATRDEVPVTPEEWTAVARIRRVRNHFSHGDSRDLPQPADLRVARAVVNRLIVHRVNKLANRRLPTDASPSV